MAPILFCLIVGIADGDTLTARCGQPGAYEQIKVRLAGIDAPEWSQPFGRRSRQSLASLCWQKQAEIEPTDKDIYGRTVARVACSGQDANAAQVSSGMAWAYTQYLADPRIAQLEAVARSERRGLWADPHPVPPWEWRKSARSKPLG
jgi:endonuclease YncB( thermonuclease family)